MINISKQIYAGWGVKVKYDLNEAEIIPLGTSSNEKKKLEKFTKTHAVIKEFENVPLPGFTLYKSDRKNWGSTDQTWLIIDPRGFLVRITNDNLEDILYVTGITEGLIQEKCVWARNNSQTTMRLVPVTSADFTEALENTEMIEGRIHIKDVQIGDKVLLQNKLVGTFMGVQSLYCPLNDYPRSGIYKPQVYLRRQIIEVEPNKFHYQSDAKILKVIEKTTKTMTRQEAVDYMNSAIQDSSVTYFTNATDINGLYYSVHGMIKYVSTHAVPKVEMSFEEITRDEADKIQKASYMSSDSGQLLLENSAGTRHTIAYPYGFKLVNSAPAIFNTRKCLLPDLSRCEQIKTEIPGRNRVHGARTPDPVETLDNFAKFYRIVKHVKNETYV